MTNKLSDDLPKLCRLVLHALDTNSPYIVLHCNDIITLIDAIDELTTRYVDTINALSPFVTHSADDLPSRVEHGKTLCTLEILADDITYARKRVRAVAMKEEVNAP